MNANAQRRERRSPSGLNVVLERELRDLWIAGRGPMLCLGFSLLVAALAYLAATNKALNFLENRESVNVVVQTGVTVGALLTQVSAADAISGERERGTLESLLVTPVSRRRVVGGKLLASLSLWLAAYLIFAPYAWFLARDVGIAGTTLFASLSVGTLLALFLGSAGLMVSLFAGSNRISLSASLFAMLALFVPTLLPGGATKGWYADALLHVNPVTSGDHFLGRVLVDGSSWGQESGWLVSPVLAAATFCAAVLVVADRMRLGAGGSNS